MPDVVSGPSWRRRDRAPAPRCRDRRAPLQGPTGGLSGSGRGREAAPRALLDADRPLREGCTCAAGRSPAAPPSSIVRVAHPLDVSVSYQAQAWAMEAPGLPGTTMPVPGLCRPPRRRRATCRARFSPRVSSEGNHSGRLRHIRSPLAGRGTSATLSGAPAGSESPDASSPTSPAPEVCPMQSAPTAPRGDRSQPARRVPHAQGVAPVSSLLLLRPLREPSVRMVEHPTGPSASGFQRPSLRGVVRARPGPKPGNGASPAGDRRPGEPPSTRPLPDRRDGPRRSHQPATSRPPVQRASPPSTPARAERPHRPGCPGRQGRKGAPAPSPAPSEGAAPLARGEAGQPGERVIGAARVAGFR